MGRKLVTVVLAVAVSLLGFTLFPALSQARLPGDHTGYAPDQPIAFSHRLHAGELEIACLYCHGGAERSRRAGIPATDVCMNCHETVPAPIVDIRAEEARAKAAGEEPRPVVSPEIEKLYLAAGRTETGEEDPDREPKPIRWARIHRLPDFVWFDHRSHVAAGEACESCHGPVAQMERVRQETTLSMGFCLDCHRQRAASAPPGGVRPSTDCMTCHF